MARNIVFVLHGIGEYQDGWMDKESSAVPALKEAARQYPFFEGKSLDSYVEFVPVLYDDVYQRILKHWSDLGDALAASLPVMPAIAEKAVEVLQEADDDNWWLNTGADVLLYWGFRLFQQRIALRVISRITSKVAETINTGDVSPNYHILAHSMGTAVAHDALYHLGTEAWLTALKRSPMDDKDGPNASGERADYLESLERCKEHLGVANPFSPELFTFASVTMISNVSALICRDPGPYNSIVQPGSATSHGAYTSNYLNINHRFDPISFVGGFSMPEGWRMRGGYDLVPEHVDTEHIGELHSASYYCRHPDLHLRLLQLYVDPYSASDKDVENVGKFRRQFGLSRITDETRQALEQLKNGETDGFRHLIRDIKAIRELFDD